LRLTFGVEAVPVRERTVELLDRNEPLIEISGSAF
jgi:hypothetical protein